MVDAEPRILIVDDDVDICRNVADILTDLGHRVEVAHNGPEALRLVRGKPFDVALLDLKMPGMDGLTLYREMKKLRAGTVALIVTAYATSKTSDDAREAGAWQVLSKPVDFGTLLKSIDQALVQPLVLVVDDDEALCSNLWDLLRGRGYRVNIAHDGPQAAEQIADPSTIIVLIDMKLPDSNGKKVFRMVRQAIPKAGTVLITGYPAELGRLVEQVLAEGADSVCYKPLDVPQLLQELERLTQARALDSNSTSA
jgi:two-component system, NtrC family, response regulator HydG